MATLYEQIGGEAAVDAVVDHFYDALLQDTRVNYIFKGVDMTRQRRMQKSFVSGALGGKPYNGKSMKAAHKHLKLTDAHFDAVTENLEASMRHFSVSDAHVRQIMAVVETTRDDVLGRDAPAAGPVEEAAAKPQASVDTTPAAAPPPAPCLTPSVDTAAFSKVSA